MFKRLSSPIQNSLMLRIAGCILGAFLYAVGINYFIVPATLYTGGIMGICQVIRTVLAENFGFHLGAVDLAGILFYIINIPLLIIAWKNLDRRFAIKTVITASAITLFLLILPVKAILPSSSDTDNARLVNCLIGGIVAGAGCGIVLLMGGTTGGVDIIAIYFFKRGKHISVGQLNLFVNLLLYSTCAYIFNIPTAIYSIIYAVISSFTVDRLHMQNINVEVNIITKIDVRDMEKEILETMNRGITRLQAEGEFTEDPVTLLYILVSKYEVTKLRNIVKKYDPHAFVTVKSGVVIYGNYLKKI